MTKRRDKGEKLETLLLTSEQQGARETEREREREGDERVEYTRHTAIHTSRVAKGGDLFIGMTHDGDDAANSRPEFAHYTMPPGSPSLIPFAKRSEHIVPIPATHNQSSTTFLNFVAPLPRGGSDDVSRSPVHIDVLHR